MPDDRTLDYWILQKAKADAEAAQQALAKSKREEQEAASPATAARRAAAAEREAAAAARAEVSAFVPDLSAITRGGLTMTSGGQPDAGTGVAGEAITDAATQLVGQLQGKLAQGARILITDEADLGAAHTTYLLATQALEQLGEAADTYLQSTQNLLVDPASRQGVGSPAPNKFFAGGALVTGAAELLPGVLSLLSTPRTVTTGSIPIGDLAAAVAVAQQLKQSNEGYIVYHDQFRLIPAGGKFETLLTELRGRRQSILDRQQALSERPTHSAAVDAIASATRLIARIDTFLQQLESTPAGANKPLLASVLLRQSLQDGSLRVLLVKAQSASGMQMVADKLILKDTFSVVGAATLTWMLLAQDGAIDAAGLATGTAHLKGKIGSSFEFDPPKH